MGKNKKNVSHIRLKFYHSDELAKAMMDDPIESIKRIWYQNYERHINLVANKAAWGDPRIALELVQSRHYVMACTNILKHWFEWDEQQCHPKNNRIC